MYYMASACPKAACSAAGFQGDKDYWPFHKYAEPSAKLISLVFGIVLLIKDPQTGDEKGLDVDEAIAHCQAHHDSLPHGSVSAVPLFQVLRLLAKALLQVSLPITCFLT